ncbi:hypothetical protein BZG36_04549 [Bifiguratus adelaidae]|uniref:Brix domain-containing protein n=1 Tax=Bifiguratus adelaidae TaxID=1938954 RepID=A0A261XV64_9FUNG|nr:hypothetical protein BZG36_04549 [Bifiguratus adelaidae]
MAKRRRKTRTHTPAQEDAGAVKIPKSFVMRSGVVGNAVTALSRDIRRTMEPNTATNLRERKTNKLKDFLQVSGQLGVTHFMIFSRTDKGTNLRIARVPRGPTLTFRVHGYSLAKDVLALQKNPRSPGIEFHTSPLLVLNNFNKDEKYLKLMTTMFQNLFPPINVQTMQLADARRIILLNYNEDTKRIDYRHYSIGVKPLGISKSVKRVVSMNMPDLSNFEDVSEYVLREAHASESDVEEGPESAVTLPQDYVGRGNKRSEQRGIKLIELGPRMELQLLKVQSGLCDGEVLYHEFVHKTPAEIKAQEKAKKQKQELAALRRKEQEANVKRREAAKEEHRARTSGKRARNESDEEDSAGSNARSEDEGSDADIVDEEMDDDE